MRVDTVGYGGSGMSASKGEETGRHPRDRWMAYVGEYFRRVYGC